MTRENISQDALSEANRNRNEFSGYQGSLGSAGYRENMNDIPSAEFLGLPGESTALTPVAGGFGEMYIGCAWNVRKTVSKNPIARLLGLKKERGVDIDLGCLYELTDGTRGALQALGDDDGAFDAAPFIHLSHDERTGAADGDDEYMRINGVAWPQVKRVLVYAYIYEGAADWMDVVPQVSVRVAGHPTLRVRPQAAQRRLAVCAIALLEQIRGGLKLTNLTEYFPGQAEMDRAYGFGLEWDAGQK